MSDKSKKKNNCQNKQSAALLAKQETQLLDENWPTLIEAYGGPVLPSHSTSEFVVNDSISTTSMIDGYQQSGQAVTTSSIIVGEPPVKTVRFASDISVAAPLEPAVSAEECYTKTSGVDPSSEKPVSQHKKNKCAVKGMGMLLQQMRNEAAKQSAAANAATSSLPASAQDACFSNANIEGQSEHLNTDRLPDDVGTSDIPTLKIPKLVEPPVFAFCLDSAPPSPPPPLQLKKSRTDAKTKSITPLPIATTTNVIDIEPLAIVRNCFHAGTVPNFGFSTQITANNYVRSCKWRPDGLAILAESEDRHIRVFNFDADSNQLSLASTTRFGGLVYDVQWHPYVDLYATTSCEAPIHLYDSTGKRHLSFRGINAVDELDHAYSLAFSTDGWTICAGYKQKLRFFDLGEPGRQVHEIKTYIKNSLIAGQLGVISSIVACPDTPGIYAVGCYRGLVGIYSDQIDECQMQFATKHSGITLMRYTPDGNKLYVGYRKSSVIECYDIRYPVMVCQTFHRPAETNQRFYFDLDSSSRRFLFSGSSDGSMLIYDLRNFEHNKRCSVHNVPVQPRWKFPVSRAAVTGVSLHPTMPILATTSGERVFPYPLLLKSDSEDSSPEQFASSEKNGEEVDLRQRKRNYTRLDKQNELDNAMKLWKL